MTPESLKMREKIKMIKKKDIYDRIVHELSIYVNDLEAKVENNLLDDNVFSEDFIKNLLK